MNIVILEEFITYFVANYTMYGFWIVLCLQLIFHQSTIPCDTTDVPYMLNNMFVALKDIIFIGMFRLNRQISK